jgi:CBS domain-containing protein
VNPIYVKDVYNSKRVASALVRADDPLEDVLRQLAEEPRLRGVFVTDIEGLLVGVITRTDILEWVRLRLGLVLKRPRLTPHRMLRLAQLVRAAKAGDAIHPASEEVAVRPEDTLDLALQLMLQTDLISVPVLDADGRILGDLTLSCVLRYLLDAPTGTVRKYS